MQHTDALLRTLQQSADPQDETFTVPDLDPTFIVEWLQQKQLQGHDGTPARFRLGDRARALLGLREGAEKGS